METRLTLSLSKKTKKQQTRNHTLNKKPLKWASRLTAGSVHANQFLRDFYKQVTVQTAKSNDWFRHKGDSEKY